MIESTKTHILTRLKRSGRATVDQLAGGLGLAPMTVRQHLTTLERDSLVDAVEVRRHTGRPHHVFRLTRTGDERFPRRYDRVAELLLQELSEINSMALDGRSGPGRVALVLEQMATRLADSYVPRVEGRPLAERVRAVAGILEEESGLAEWREVQGGYEIRDLSCVYRRLIGGDAQLCGWHARFVSLLVGREVQPAPGDCNGVDCCRCVVME